MTENVWNKIPQEIQDFWRKKYNNNLFLKTVEKGGPSKNKAILINISYYDYYNSSCIYCLYDDELNAIYLFEGKIILEKQMLQYARMSSFL